MIEVCNDTFLFFSTETFEFEMVLEMHITQASMADFNNQFRQFLENQHLPFIISHTLEVVAVNFTTGQHFCLLMYFLM